MPHFTLNKDSLFCKKLALPKSDIKYKMNTWIRTLNARNAEATSAQSADSTIKNSEICILNNYLNFIEWLLYYEYLCRPLHFYMLT